MNKEVEFDKLTLFARVCEEDTEFAKELGFEFEECIFSLCKNGLLRFEISWCDSKLVRSFVWPEYGGNVSSFGYPGLNIFKYRFSDLCIDKETGEVDRELDRTLNIEIGVQSKDPLVENPYSCFHQSQMKFRAFCYFFKSDDLDEMKEIR